jgi:ATP-dependent Clp protease ATP-binding subunit ClpX
MFELDGVGLEFEPAALEAIAEQAVARKTGARGLRAILENLLGPVMFEVPSAGDVAKVVVTRESVLGESTPLVLESRRGERESA